MTDRSSDESGNQAAASTGFARVFLTVLPSLLFLAGGVVTYVVPGITSPLYIAGSAAMFANAVMRLGPGRGRGASSIFVQITLRALAVAAVLVVSFGFGYLL